MIGHELLYTNVEADLSPARSRGFQVWLASKELDAEDRRFIARRVDDYRLPAGVPPDDRTFIRHSYFRVRDRFAVARTVPVARRDKFGRGGLFHAHVVVLEPADFLLLDFDPFRVIDRFEGDGEDFADRLGNRSAHLAGHGPPNPALAVVQAGCQSPQLLGHVLGHRVLHHGPRFNCRRLLQALARTRFSFRNCRRAPTSRAARLAASVRTERRASASGSIGSPGGGGSEWPFRSTGGVSRLGMEILLDGVVVSVGGSAPTAVDGSSAATRYRRSPPRATTGRSGLATRNSRNPRARARPRCSRHTVMFVA